MQARLLTTLTLIVVGVLLGTLGTFSLPVHLGISLFWPGMAVQVMGGVWFGTWGGLVAAGLFPIFSNALTGGGVANVLGFIPANIAQGMIPAWAFRRFRMPYDIPGWRGLLFYAVWGAIVPSVAGAILGVGALCLFGKITGLAEFMSLASTWALSNAFSSLVLGPAALRVLTPLLGEYGLTIKGYWR